MSIHARHIWNGKLDIIENKDRTGVDKKFTESVTKTMTLNLDSIKYRVDNMRSKRKIPRNPEEILLLTNMAPACHSQHIRNDYSLNVNVKYNGCTCCSAVPSISIPLTVIPLTHMESYGF
jgi:hypothetical protein